MPRLICRALGVFIVLTLSFAAFAQTAQVSGRVIDPSEALVRGADVRVVSQTTGIERRVKTNLDGTYTVPFVSPGTYQVFVQVNGFSTAVSEPLTVTVGQELVFNVQLKVGTSAQEVTVEAGSQMLNTTDASVSTVVDRKFVENIPLNGRSIQDLISMTPGVVTQSPQASSILGYSGDFSVNGQRTQSNYYMVDGVSGNIGAGNGTGGAQAANSGTIASSTALGTTQSLISVDALQEFRVQSSTYSAEYGRTPGGQFSLVTRSGTNSLHGSLYDYLRNNFFDANDWFNDHAGKAMTPLRQNDFGGTFGAPVVLPHLYDGRNRSFIFVSYEGLRLTLPQAASIQYVPDTCMRQNAPAPLRAILNAYPIQNGIDYGTCTAGVTAPSLAQFIQPYSLPSTVNSTSARLDQVISPRLTVFFRAGYTPTFATTRALSSLAQTHINTQTYTMGATAQLASTTTDEFRLGYSKSSSAQAITLDSFGGATPTDLSGAEGISNYPNAAPEAYLSFSGIGISVLRTNNSRNQGMQWNAINTVSISQGHHLLKLGIDFRHIVSPLTPPPVLANAEYLSASSILSNSATIGILQKFVGATPIFNETAVFIQDEFHVLSRLNLSYGLRWEVDPPPTEQNGNSPYTLLGNINNPSSLALAPQGTPLWKTTWYNVAPRFGAAWTAHATPGWETVVRAGGGVFFDTDDEIATAGYSYLGFHALSILRNAAIPFSTAQLNFTTAPTAPYGTLVAFSNHLQLPYTLQWNGSIEQAFGKQQSLSISYVGSSGRRLLQQQQHNISALNPLFTTVLSTQGNVTSSYQSLQLKFQRSIAHGVQSLVSYTWSHSLDFGSNSSALPLTYGNSDFDVRHNLEGGLSWDLPSAKTNKVLQAVTENWAVDGRVMARTAFPITLQGTSITDPATGNVYYGNINVIAGRPLYLYGSQYPGGRALNGGPSTTTATAALVTAGTGTGDAARNFVRGFGAAQINAAVRREFHLYENLNMQFRAEAFNILNHPNFGYVDPTLTDAQFGQATQMLNSSLGTVAAQYQQGGPRSLQFALKLQF